MGRVTAKGKGKAAAAAAAKEKAEKRSATVARLDESAENDNEVKSNVAQHATIEKPSPQTPSKKGSASKKPKTKNTKEVGTAKRASEGSDSDATRDPASQVQEQDPAFTTPQKSTRRSTRIQENSPDSKKKKKMQMIYPVFLKTMSTSRKKTRLILIMLKIQLVPECCCICTQKQV